MAVEKVVDLGPLTTYDYAVEGGYQGTEEEYAEYMATITDVIDEAEQSAKDASASATQAGASATAAASSASDSADSASASASSASAASGSASSASQSASNASASALASAASASDSEASAQASAALASAADTSAKAAASSAESATGSATNAASSAGSAAGSATNAAASATSATGSARDSEAWAVGQRGGVDVESDDETYENNAKYYAEQAGGSATASVAAKTAAESARDVTIQTKNTAVSEIQTAGTTQVASVNSAGATQVQAVEDKGEEVLDSIPSDYSELSDTVDLLSWTKAPVIHNSLSNQGVASFDDGAEDMPLDELKVYIEPVQDLHGYDNPWPAGGGVNKVLPSDIDISNTVQSVTATWAADAEELTLNGTNSGSYAIIIHFTNDHIKLPDVQTRDTWTLATDIPTGAYIGVAYKNTSNVEAQKWYINGDGTFKKVTQSVPDDFASFLRLQIGINPSATFTNAKCHIAFVSDSTITSWTPYSNICPISGRTGVTVTRTGKNLLDVYKYGNALPKTHNGITWSKVRDGLYHASGTATATSYFNISFKTDATDSMPATQFRGKRIYLSTSDARIIPSVGVYKADGTFVSIQNGGIVPDDAFNLRAYVRVEPHISSDIDTDFTIQLELGSTATAYEPYQGETYPITFPTEAGTVYGGQLTVHNDGTGELVVDSANIASYAGETLPGAWISDRDVYSAGATPTTGAQVVYDLATPITYTLTAEQVCTLLGYNNIWADAGNVDVIYPADTKLYIDKKFAELQALILENISNS